MKAYELAKLLLNQPDGEINVSVDISTGDDDAERRAFADVIDLQSDTNPANTVILCEGYLNDETSTQDHSVVTSIDYTQVQLHAGIAQVGSGAGVHPLWHTDQVGLYWSGQWHHRTPKQLLKECQSIIEDLIRNHPDLTDPDQFDWDCPSCGRYFEDMTREELATGCPSDDCPSHWEEKGTPHPEYEE